MSGYRVVFASARAEKDIAKFLGRLPGGLPQQLYDAMKTLGRDPRPPQTIHLSGRIEIYGHAAQYRLRFGDYRILYDIDDRSRTVVVLAVRRRSEKTYD